MTDGTRMSLKVYTVDSATGARQTLSEQTVQRGDYSPNPYDLGTYPPCRCPRHRDQGAAGVIR